jgi:16S rRNA (cytosine1407-C5)-methyltransferase
VALLKVGGELVYSTCTMHPEENEGNVAWALQEYPNTLELIDIDAKYKIGNPGLSSFDLTVQQTSFVQRFSPLDQSLDTNAFFIAKFKKVR